MSFMIINNCVSNIFNIINNLKLFHLMHDTFFIVVKILSKRSWLISYYPSNVNVIIIFMAANDNIWLMLYYPANVDIIQMLTLPVTYKQTESFLNRISVTKNVRYLEFLL